MKTQVGEITHFFPNVMVAVVKVAKDMKLGDKILIEGNITNFEQTIESMQIDRKPISAAKKGQEIGLKVDEVVKEKDKIYKP
jgi:putative protease